MTGAAVMPPPLDGFVDDVRPIATGLDLSLTYTGIATVCSDRSITVGSARSTGHRDDSIAVKARRFAALADQIAAQVPADVEHVVVEAPAYGMPQGAVDLGGLRWLVLTRLTAAGHLVSEVNPMHVKSYATGEKKRADKDQVVAAVVRRYPQADVTNNNTADAVILAAMGARRQGYPVDDITVLRQVAYDKVRWSA